MSFCDSHAHLTSNATYEQIPEMLERAKKENIGCIINICTDKTSLERGLKLVEDVKWIYNVGATTPHDVEKEGEIYFPLFEEAARRRQLVAIGETGLDYHYKEASKSAQRAFFIRYLQLAIDCNLPVVIHCRAAFDDLFAIADEHYKNKPLLLHCFTGNMEEAEKALDRNYFISFSGILTFKKSTELREVAKEIPLSHILIETDTPYLAPQSRRGKPNEPSFLPETAQTVAQIKGVSLEKVRNVTLANAQSFFSLQKQRIE